MAMQVSIRRLAAAVAAVSFALCAHTLSVPAAESDLTVSDFTGAKLRPLYIQDDMRLTSAINPAFSSDWYAEKIPEAGGIVATSTINMRGFAMSPDGRYTYMSVLHGGGDIVRGMFVMETMTGKILSYDTRYDGDVCDAALPHFSYPKGIATDSRGYVYIGYTLSESYNEVYLRIAQQNEDGSLTGISEIPVCSFGTPGDANGQKVGINGVDILEMDGRVYCYVVTNYEHDALYILDVTDPERPVKAEDLGQGGKIDLSGGSFAPAGHSLNEAYYFDVEADGTIYLAMDTIDGRGGVAVISPDGLTCRRVIEVEDVYSVEVVGNYLLCGSRTSGAVTILDHRSDRRITSLSTADTYGERIVRMQVVRGVLFVCDAGSVAGSSNAIYAAPLTEEGQAYLDAIVLAQNAGYAVYETETETETAAPGSAPTLESSPDTSPMETTETSCGEVTDRETDRESAEPTTTVPTDTSAESNADTEEIQDTGSQTEPAGGCASLAAGWMILSPALLAAAVIGRKKH